MIEAYNGKRFSTKIRKEPNGTYSKVVFFGPRDFASVVRRNFYQTYKQAQQGDISDSNVIGSHDLI